jgi:hypothetical protein
MHTENDTPQNFLPEPAPTGLNDSGFKDSLKYNEGTAEVRFYSVKTCIKSALPSTTTDK